MDAGSDPDLIRHPWRVWTASNIVAANFEDPQLLFLLLPEDVAKHATFLHLVMLPRRSQLVQDAPRNKCGRHHLRRRVVKLLSGVRAEMLERR